MGPGKALLFRVFSSAGCGVRATVLALIAQPCSGESRPPLL